MAFFLHNSIAFNINYVVEWISMELSRRTRYNEALSILFALYTYIKTSHSKKFFFDVVYLERYKPIRMHTISSNCFIIYII